MLRKTLQIGLISTALLAPAYAQAPAAPPTQVKVNRTHLPKQPKTRGAKARTYKSQIEGLEEKWRAAQLANDSAAVEKLLSDDYIGIAATGLVATKQETLERMQARMNVLSKLDVTDQKVTVHGDTAVVTCEVNLQGAAGANGTTAQTPLTGRYRYTRVYVRDPKTDTWQIVNFESTRVNAVAEQRNQAAKQVPAVPAPQP